MVDIFWMVVSAMWVLTCWYNDPWQAIAWAMVFMYALINRVERRLKGSKYDY